MTGFVDKLGLSGPLVLKKEMGELLKTLIRTTPPKNPTKTRASISDTVSSRFEAAAEDRSFERSHYNGQVGASGILWYQVDSKFLRGVAPDKDMRKAGVEELEALRWRITPKGRLNLPFKHPHKSQRVLIYQKILTRKSTVNKLIAKLKTHVGRLKAGWLASWDFLSPTGGNQPPQWVTRHKSGARGYFVNGLGVKGYPTFTIANTAKGVGNQKLNLNGIVRTALAIRAKAMSANLRMFMRGKKNMADYAK